MNKLINVESYDEDTIMNSAGIRMTIQRKIFTLVIQQNRTLLLF